MAERTASRAGLQRTTSRNAPEYNRTTRTTRSQSREISDGEGGRHDIARRGQQPESTGSLQSGDDIVRPKARKGRSSKQARALQELPTVSEGESINYPNIQTEGVQEDVEVEESAHEEAVHDGISPGGISVFSGTTARTSRSAQELAGLMSDELVDALPDLYDASSKLIQFLVASDIPASATNTLRSQLQNENSREHKKLLRLDRAFQVQREVYGDALFINPTSVLGIMIKTKSLSNIPASRWRPDPLFQRANLAALAASALMPKLHSDNEQFLEELVESFPKLFVTKLVDPPDFTVGRSELLEETVLFALEIRTRYAIVQLARYVDRPNFDSDNVLSQVFFQDSKTPKGWNVEGLRSDYLGPHSKNAISRRLQEIRKIIGDNSISPESSEAQAIAIQRLRAHFTWNDLVDHALRWISLRDDEIQSQLAMVDGAESIAQHLEIEIRKRKLAKSSPGNEGIRDDSPQLVLEYEQPSEVSHAVSEQNEDLRGIRTRVKKLKLAQFSANSPKAKAAAAHIKQREASRSNKKTKELVTAQHHEDDASRAAPRRNFNEARLSISAPVEIVHAEPKQQQVADLQAQDEEDNGDDFFQSQISNPHVIAEDILRRQDQREKESNKENQLDVPDSQLRSGKRLHITDRQPNAQRVQFDSQGNSGSQDESEYVDEDEADQRQRQRSFKRKALVPLETLDTQARSTKKVHLQQGLPRNVIKARGGRNSSQQTVPPPSQFDTYSQANASAKEIKAMKPKKPQSRKAWSDEETGTFINLICEFGTSWALLKDVDSKRGHVLERRDQYALKDKARNLKIVYLTSAQNLPVNFEHIILSKPQVERLNDTLEVEYDPQTGRRKDASIEDLTDT